jgi:hypothetical protein
MPAPKRALAASHPPLRRKTPARTLVGALLELLVVCGLLDDVEDGDAERGVGEGVGLGGGTGGGGLRRARNGERTGKKADAKRRREDV